MGLVVTLLLCSSVTPAHADDRITRALGELRWGMSKQRVQARLPSYRHFTGGDASALLGELLTGRGQTFWLGRDALSRMVYVFHAGKLKQIYKLFEPLAFPEGNFQAFSATLQRRFGPGEARTGELAAGSGVFRHWIEWHDQTTRLRAVDETNHRGFYCLIFEASD